MVSAEEAVEALIEGIVSPFLPRRSIMRESPSLEQQEIVAKQMHAVVLLYNYYHRKQFSKLEFLNFKSFCKIACISKPSLLKYMNAMYKSDMSSGDLDEPLSITENMIMDACNVCMALDASKDAPDMDGWPISKVAVFLVDRLKENCLLKSGSNARIFKSLVEKSIKMPIENVDDVLQEAAFSIVQEEMGISHSNLSILGYYISYSLSHVKSCTRLYIMCYVEPIDNQTPIKAVMQSLQGPLVKFNGPPEVTKVIEYYSLLPYKDIFSDWLSRKTSYTASHNDNDSIKKGLEGLQVVDIHEVGDDSACGHEIKSSCFDKSKTSKESSCGNEKYSPQNTVSNYFVKREALPAIQEVENEGDLPSLNALTSKKRKVTNVFARSSSLSPIAASHHNADDSSIENKVKCRPSQAGGAISNMIVALNTYKDDAIGAPLKILDMKSALQLLKKKREELCHQQRLLEDNIAHCEMSIQTVLSGKDFPASKLDSMLNSCEFLFSNEMKNDKILAIEAKSHPETICRKKLCEAVLCLQSPSQELDEIFCTNNWILPKYCVLPSADDEKFQALVTVRGMDFESASNGEWKSNPREARESAAAHMLSKLRSMATAQEK